MVDPRQAYVAAGLFPGCHRDRFGGSEGCPKEINELEWYVKK